MEKNEDHDLNSLTYDLISQYSLFELFFPKLETAVLAGPFFHYKGYCWYAKLPQLESFSDNVNEPARSPLALFEEGILLNDNHALHDDIACLGAGRYSHWGDHLYFSSRDNSDPNINNKVYTYLRRKNVFSLLDDQSIHDVSNNWDIMHKLISIGLNTNAHPINQSFHGYTKFLELLKITGDTYHNKTVLEIGSSPRLGLALILALTGVKKIVCNNILEIPRIVDLSFLNLLRLTTGIIANKLQFRNSTDFLSISNDCANVASLAINANIIEIVDKIPIDKVNILENSVDIIFSQSVLEHVSEPLNAISKCFELLKPGAYSYHSVDLTEHASPEEPLSFLKYDEEEYILKTGRPENRVRYSEFIDYFKKVGFEIQAVNIYTHPYKHLTNGSVDIASIIEKSTTENIAVHKLSEVIPWVSDEYQKQFASPFNQKDVNDLSVLYFDIICRKPYKLYA
jgi:SAM-dependent methyltransferase